MDNHTLFDRLGGAKGVATLVDQIVAAHLANPTISVRFQPYAADPERFGELKDHLRKFLMAGSGGPNAYTGRTMPEAHQGLNISVAEYMAAVDDIMEVLERNEIPESARKDVLAITYSLKRDIVHL